MTTTLVVIGYVATILSGLLAAVATARLGAKNAKQDRLHAMRVDACAEAMEYAQIVRARLDSAEEEYGADFRPRTPELPPHQPISARLHLLVPTVAEQFDDLALRFSGFIFWCNENLQPGETPRADDTEQTRAALESLVRMLKTAVA